MSHRNAVWFFVLVVAAYSSNSAAQQETDEDTGDPAEAGAETAVSDTEEADDEEDEELEEDETAETSDGDAGQNATLEPPKNLELDMEALGEMDPEKDLLGDGQLSEDAAAAEVVEDWTERDLELLELHGYMRVRPELFHKFYMRHTDDEVFPRPAVHRDENNRMDNNSLAGANMRLRVEPTLNISEEVRIKAQIDFLDNVMLGSTPRYWQNYVASDAKMIETGRVQGWDMGPPDSSDAIAVRRAWGEVTTQLGQLRFGRMGDHWGLGMLHNAGNGIEQDFGDTVDRIMFATKINDWIFAPAFDFPNEGMAGKEGNGYPFDVSQLDDAYRLVGILAYKHDREDQLAMLRRGDWLVNTGVYFSYQSQVQSFELPRTDDSGELGSSQSVTDPQFYTRETWSITPDFWFQFLFDTFHLEIEAAMVYGKVGNPERNSTFDTKTLELIQFGAVTQVDYGLLSDQLRIGLEVGFAMGDRGVERLRAPATYDQMNSFNNPDRPDPSDTEFTAFSFNPAYNTDLILFRHILGSVSQSYYFHPWLRYDFLKSEMGKRMSMQADVIYSRAVWEKSTIANDSANLGVEVNASFIYQSEDHFYAGLKYGVLFPLSAFEGTVEVPGENPGQTVQATDDDLTVPQTLQGILGITY